MKAATWTTTVMILALSTAAQGITRDQVLARAKAYAYHPWRCSDANLTATCSSSYASVYIPGDYMGLPYDWGGYMTLFEFDQQISQGYGAGSYSADGILECTSGLDCSGFVSKCWDAGHFSTSTMHFISSDITEAELLPGDAMNQAGSHIVLYSHRLGSGEPAFYESAGYNVHYSAYRDWSSVSGYTPIRFDNIEGSSAGDPIGTTTNPIVIGSMPYSDTRNTTQSSSDVLDGCGASPAQDESGPEYIYKVTLTQHGSLTASVASDAGADIDVLLTSSTNSGDCIAWSDTTLTQTVDCGTYYIVADTATDTEEHPGGYTLTVSFSPSGQSCGGGPPAYNPKGELGDLCANPYNENLPFCNENLGGVICIYSTSSSFCSRPCATSADCSAFSGGCCEDVSGQGEYYCLPGAWCPSPQVDSSVVEGDAAAGQPDASLPKGDSVAGGDTILGDGQVAVDGSTGDGSGEDPDADADGDGDGDGDGGCACGVGRSGGGAAAPLILLGIGLFGLLGLFKRRSRRR